MKRIIGSDKWFDGRNLFNRNVTNVSEKATLMSKLDEEDETKISWNY